LNIILQGCRFAKPGGQGTSIPDFDRAVETFNAAESLGIQPNVETFEQMLAIASFEKNAGYGHKLMEEMKQKEMKPSEKAYVAMIKIACFEPGYEQAFVLLEEMKAQNIVPPMEAYTAIIKRCGLSRDPRAQIAMEEMRVVGYVVPRELAILVQTGKYEPSLRKKARVKSERDGLAQDDPFDWPGAGQNYTLENEKSSLLDNMFALMEKDDQENL